MQPLFVIPIVWFILDLSAYGLSVEIPVTRDRLDQGVYVFSVSTNAITEGVAFHVSIAAKKGAIASDSSVGVCIVRHGGEGSAQIVAAKPAIPVTLETNARVWKADFAISYEKLKLPGLAFVFTELDHLSVKGKKVLAGSAAFYVIKLRDFAAVESDGRANPPATASPGCCSGAPKATAVADSSWEPFRIIPPIADADPSVRHAVLMRVPTRMLVVRHRDSLAVSFPTLETTNLMVGHKMVTGVMREDAVIYDGLAHPRGMSLGGVVFETSTNVLTFGQEGIPKAGREFTLEQRVTIFETDMPVQHMWSPQSGKHYRVLWARTFRETVR
jgi:hypothetical protein